MVESTTKKGELPALVDYIAFAQDRELMALLGNDTLVFASKVKKTNMFEWTQERTLAITNNGLYNIHKKTIKRHIPMKDVCAMTKTCEPSKNVQEFTVHVPTEYDYRFLSERREEIMDIIKAVYDHNKGGNIPVYHADAKDLKEFTTTEKDMKAKRNRFPPETMLAKGENLFDGDGTHAGGEDSVNPLENNESYAAANQERMDQLKANQNFADQSTRDSEVGDDLDEMDNQTRQSMAGGAAAVFARDGQPAAALQDFEIKKMIGKGTFGKVFLVQQKGTDNLFAMKCIRKDIILENEQMENIQLEKDILWSINHPFLVNMEYVFQNEFRIYFLMKFIKGGELFRHLVEVRKFPENQAKFFAMQVALALGHLHSKQIIYRDLKPENVLVGEDGYLLVADFGLAKAVNNSELANSFCGTAEYLAPEMLIGNGHDYTVDWWALGILIYEMIVGIPPFFHRNKHRMYFLIRESPVNFPDPVRHKITVSPEAQDLIVKLLDKNRKTRLGANGMDEILAHPWFADIDKEKLIAKTLDPPYVPQTKDDFAYFDKNLVKQTANEVADTILTPTQQKVVNNNPNQFDGFAS